MEYVTPEDYEKAAKNGIKRKNVYQRVYIYGWSVEKAITKPATKQKDRSKWVEMAKENGISSGTFYSRLNIGWDPEKAATHPLISKEEWSRKVVQKQRVLPVEWVQTAKENGISRETLRQRIKKGWDPEKAKTLPPMSPTEAGKFGKTKGWTEKWRIPKSEKRRGEI